MRLLISIVFVSLIASAFAQTKPIAYRSHSGNMRHFTLAGPDNLGLGKNDLRYLFPDSVPQNIFLMPPVPAPDTLGYYPFCTNPDMHEDTMALYFPAYSRAMKKDKESKLVGPQNQPGNDTTLLNTIPEKNSTENTNAVFTEQKSGSDLTKGNPETYFKLSLFAILPLIGLLIWYTNRNKVVSGSHK